MRVKGGKSTHRRHKKIMKAAKGYVLSRSKVYSVAKITVDRAMAFAYRDRKNKKRTFRRLWIQRINAAARQHGLSYSVFAHGLKLANIELDRKTLAELAISQPQTFGTIVEDVKAVL